MPFTRRAIHICLAVHTWDYCGDCTSLHCIFPALLCLSAHRGQLLGWKNRLPGLGGSGGPSLLACQTLQRQESGKKDGSGDL